MKLPFSIHKVLPKQWALIIIATLTFGCKKEKAVSNTVSNPVASSYSLAPRVANISPHCKGFYEYLPEGYLTDAPNTKYPLLIFFHGGGEIGSDSSALSKVLVNGPLKHVKNGDFPTSFTVNGKTYRFIIIAPQFTSSDAPYVDEINTLIEYAKQNYRVDASRIYLTGLSIGGGQCWNYVGNNNSYVQKIAAIVPIAAYIKETSDDFKIDAAKASVIASSNLPIWSTHNNADNTCPLSWITDAYDLLKNSNPSMIPLPKLTIFNGTTHEGWTQTYNPSFKENNLNIYEWMLQYHR